MVKTPKRFYWLKLEKRFFDSKEIKLLRKIPGGDTYTIIYLKLLLSSLEVDGKILFEGIGNDLAEDVALEIDEDVEAVRITLNFLEQKQLMTYEVMTDSFLLTEAKAMTGQEGASAARMRRHREKKQVSLCDSSVTESDDIKRKRKKEIEIDIELELDKEIEQEKELSSSSCINNKELIRKIEESFGRLLSPMEIEEIQKWVSDDGYKPDVILEALKEAVFKAKPNLRYIQGILRNWKNDNLTTVELIEAKRRERENSHVPKNITASDEFMEAMDYWKDTD
ncbi:DnaD domain protein [Streptococcus sp. ZJ93]|uniref:DnaD domain protein n=1 Tax=Streptococcus handemini TaxID=3161188 RepID=UPI0034D5B101